MLRLLGFCWVGLGFMYNLVEWVWVVFIKNFDKLTPWSGWGFVLPHLFIKMMNVGLKLSILGVGDGFGRVLGVLVRLYEFGGCRVDLVASPVDSAHSALGQVDLRVVWVDSASVKSTYFIPGRLSASRLRLRSSYCFSHNFLYKYRNRVPFFFFCWNLDSKGLDLVYYLGHFSKNWIYRSPLNYSFEIERFENCVHWTLLY